MNATQVKRLQRALNFFFRHYLAGQAPLIVDGNFGPLTRRYTRRAKWYLGYGGTNDATVTDNLIHRLRHPKRRKYASWKIIARGARRRTEQRRLWRKRHPKVGDGVGTFDGRPVANWLIPYLRWARGHGWRGTLVSGYRTPAYSEHLCYEMCGAPSCPGRCAGRATNHAKFRKPDGAMDVSDYIRFAQVIAQCPYAPRVFNALPADRVHFSSSGR